MNIFGPKCIFSECTYSIIVDEYSIYYYIYINMIVNWKNQTKKISNMENI